MDQRRLIPAFVRPLLLPSITYGNQFWTPACTVALCYPFKCQKLVFPAIRSKRSRGPFAMGDYGSPGRLDWMRPGLNQDVYRCRCAGMPIYTKLQIGPEGQAVVISFKRDESA